MTTIIYWTLTECTQQNENNKLFLFASDDKDDIYDEKLAEA